MNISPIQSNYGLYNRFNFKECPTKEINIDELNSDNKTRRTTCDIFEREIDDELQEGLTLAQRELYNDLRMEIRY